MRKYTPLDLRKVVSNDNFNDYLKVIHHYPHKKLNFDIPKYLIGQNDINIDDFSSVFTESYNAPEVYTAYAKDILVSPKVRGLPRYHAMFLQNHYIFNFINNGAKANFVADGIFNVVDDNIIFDFEKFKKESITITGKSVWLFTFNNIDHLLRECLPALITLKELNEDFSKLKFIVAEISPNVINLLNLLGIPKQNILSIQGQWLYFEELIIPCFGSFGHLHTPTQYYVNFAKYQLDCIKNQGITAPPHLADAKRIYVSRKRAKMRRVLNEEALFDGLKQRNFAIIDPGDYSIAEQTLIFSKAEVILGPHGMGIANCVFSKNLKLLCEIIQTNYNRVSYFRTAQWLNCQYAGYYVTPIDLNYCLDSDSYGDVLIDKNQFFNFLDERLANL